MRGSLCVSGELCGQVVPPGGLGLGRGALRKVLIGKDDVGRLSFVCGPVLSLDLLLVYLLS